MTLKELLESVLSEINNRIQYYY